VLAKAERVAEALVELGLGWATTSIEGSLGKKGARQPVKVRGKFTVESKEKGKLEGEI
jgi:hypothetical protein